MNISKIAQKRNARFQILTDSDKATISLFANGSLLHTWTDPKGFGGKGKGLLFYPQSQYPMKVRNILVTQWNGQMPSQNSDPDTQKQDIIRLANGDKVTGKLVGIKNGETSFKTEFATLTVPINRIQHLTLGTEDQGRARRRENDVALKFHGGGSMTIALEGFKDGTFMGKSENFGTISADAAAFGLMTFNIYEEAVDTEDDGWE